MRPLSRLCGCFFLIAAAAPVALPAQSLTFAAPRSISGGAIYLYGNFNGNGNTDLITQGGEFLAGDGIGNFSDKGQISPLPPESTHLAADANGDGKDDIIILMGGCQSLPCSIHPNDPEDGDGIITVLLSQGNGQFTQGYVGTLPSGLGRAQGVADDFNKDGKVDIAVLAYAIVTSSDEIGYTAPAELCIFLNQGNGTFTQTDYQTPQALWSQAPTVTNLVTGDFEGNGNRDVASAYDFVPFGGGTPSTYQKILTFAGNGKGGFGPGVVSYTFDSFPVVNPLFAADLNRDGRTDLLTSLQAKPPNQATGNIRVPSLLAAVSGRFYWSSAVYLDLQPADYPNILLNDFNGDGNPDLFYVGSSSPSGSQPVQAGFYLGLGNGAFKTPHIPLALKGINQTPAVIPIPLKTGDLPSLLVETSSSPNLQILVNTTKK